MKRILALTLSLIFLAALCGCSSPIIYEEENAANAWLKERTKGYTFVESSSYMRLYVDEEGFTVEIDTGSDMIPVLSVDDDVSNIVASERDSESSEGSILIANTSNSFFAKASHEASVFNPFTNSYDRAMQVYQKDETTFRIFFWLNANESDFYPIPKLLTQEQYDEVLKLVNTYTEEKYTESELAGEDPFNYAGEFMSIYEGKYVSDLATNPNGEMFYQYNGTESDNLYLYRDFISQLGLTEQDWRVCYEELGYIGPKPQYQIIYCDMKINESTIDLTLKTGDVYNSPALKAANLQLTYTFCPTLAQQPFMNVTQE